jgi:LacI family transcriptional regulator
MTRRVRQVAAQLGYIPNIMARSLASRRSGMIGLIVPKVAHFFFSAVIEGVYDAAFERNYETILTVSQENADRELKHLQTLASMRVEGIIISVSQQTQDPERFIWVRRLGVPLLFVDRRPEPPLPGFCSVLADDYGGAFQATEHAIQVGHRTLGFVGGKPTVNIGRDRLRGFEDAMAGHGILVRRDWVVLGGYGKECGYEGMKQLHRNGTLPEFILAATYPIALGIFEASMELGIRIPDTLDLICFGDAEVVRFLSPSVSVVRQPTRELGVRAVQMLVDCIHQPEQAKDRHIVLPVELVLRETGRGKKAPGEVLSPVPVPTGTAPTG